MAKSVRVSPIDPHRRQTDDDAPMWIRRQDTSVTEGKGRKSQKPGLFRGRLQRRMVHWVTFSSSGVIAPNESRRVSGPTSFNAETARIAFAKTGNAKHGLPSKSVRRVGLSVLAFAATLCLVWTCWLMLLTIAPNATVNAIMNTSTFDNSAFWRFIDPPAYMLGIGLSGLTIVALAYLYIIVRVTVFRHRQFGSKGVRKSRRAIIHRYCSAFKRRLRTLIIEVSRTESNRFSSKSASDVVRQAAVVVLSLTAVESSSRRLVVRNTSGWKAKARR